VSWKLHSLRAQVEYVLDVYGLDSLAENFEIEIQNDFFKLDPQNTVTATISKRTFEIPVSKILESTIKIGQFHQPEEEREESPLESFKDQIAMIDQMIPADVYESFEIKIEETRGGELQRQISSRMLAINEGKLVEAVMGLASMGGDLSQMTGGQEDLTNKANELLPENLPSD
jgi:hypothetical protein